MNMAIDLSTRSPYHNQYNGQIDYELLAKQFTKEMKKNYTDWYLELGMRFNDFQHLINFCILHSSQQFNFWYGDNKYKPFSGKVIIHHLLNSYNGINDLKYEIKNSCLAFIPERLQYLDELSSTPISISEINDLNTFINYLLHFSAFNSDPFFKKGLLAIIEIRRILDNYHNKKSTEYKKLDKIFDKSLISQFPIPADYRIPEFLANNNILIESILNKEFIANSQDEAYLRSSTIVEISRISQATDIPTYDLDGYIFMNKKDYNHFHMCQTTFY